MFTTRSLSIIVIRTQNLFREEQNGNFDTAPLDFSRIQDNIVHNRKCRVSLPSALIPSKKNKMEKNSEVEEEPGTTKEKTHVFLNLDVSPEWKLVAGENFCQNFHKNRYFIPKRSDSHPICTTIHLMVSCYTGRSLDHERINMDTPTHTKVNKWCSDCWAGFF